MKRLYTFLSLLAFLPISSFAQDTLFQKAGNPLAVSDLRYYGGYLQFRFFDRPEIDPDTLKYANLSGIRFQDRKDELLKFNKQAHTIWLIKYAPYEKIKGRFHSLEGGDILVISEDLQPHRHPMEGIDKITVRKKNAVSNGTLIGTGAGLILGALFGAVGADASEGLASVYTLGEVDANISPVPTIIIGGIFGGASGALIGSLIRKRFDTKKENMETIRQRLKTFALVY